MIIHLLIVNRAAKVKISAKYKSNYSSANYNNNLTLNIVLQLENQKKEYKANNNRKKIL